MKPVERILTDELSSKKRRVSREVNGAATPTRDENETRQRLGSIENGTRARMSSSDANETINIKSKWGDDSESEEEQPPPQTHFQGNFSLQKNFISEIKNSQNSKLDHTKITIMSVFSRNMASLKKS